MENTVKLIVLLLVCSGIYYLYMRYYGYKKIQEHERKGALKMLRSVMYVIEKHRWIKNVHVREIREVFDRIMDGENLPEPIEQYDGNQGRATKPEDL